VNPNEAPPVVASPIADLSYRGYDGPLRAHPARWWIVALAGIRAAFKNRWFWALAAGAFLPYVFHGLIFYVTTVFAPQGGGGPPMMGSDANGQRYAMVFFQAFTGFEWLWLFAIALMVGAGSIASDNGANALQVYLSKPITKADYLLGKWMSIFLMVSFVALAPAVLMYAFLGAACANLGFFKNEPLLFPHVVLACLIPGAIHASLLVGFSAWCTSSRIAGALYAAFTFASKILVGILWMVHYDHNPAKGLLLQHGSVDGVISGLAQRVYGIAVQVSPMFRRRAMMGDPIIPPPNVLALGGIALGACLLAIAAARWRIRAVEVVRG
jgi:ABC-2 type transport system permease protein